MKVALTLRHSVLFFAHEHKFLMEFVKWFSKKVLKRIVAFIALLIKKENFSLSLSTSFQNGLYEADKRRFIQKEWQFLKFQNSF